MLSQRFFFFSPRLLVRARAATKHYIGPPSKQLTLIKELWGKRTCTISREVSGRRRTGPRAGPRTGAHKQPWGRIKVGGCPQHGARVVLCGRPTETTRAHARPPARPAPPADTCLPRRCPRSSALPASKSSRVLRSLTVGSFTQATSRRSAPATRGATVAAQATTMMA